MSFFTYMLRCADGTIYTGHTDNLDIRFAQHQMGYFCSCYTAKRRPVALLWSDWFATRVEALEAERRLKGWSKAKKQALAAGDWAAVRELARCRTGVSKVPPLSNE